MAFYDQQQPQQQQQQQQQHGRQQSWEQTQMPSQASAGPGDNMRWSGRTSDAGGSPTPQREDSQAFATQFEEIERAHENLAKGGRGFGQHNRRESLPLSGQFSRQFPDFDRGPSSHRNHSIGGGSDYDGGRSNSAHSSSTYQGYLANQRFGPRQSEAEQMLQFKRRAAAQRERELRNYHQEQQFNRNQSGPKSDRSMSPNAMNEEDRRELIARQHRALYGDGSNLYMGDGSSPRPVSQDARVLAAGAPGGHGESYEPYGPPAQSSTAESNAPMPAASGQGQRSRENTITSKSPGPNTFAMFDANQQANRTSASSPGGSPTRQAAAPQANSGVAPIGTRPTQAPTGPGKRSTPPMSSPLNPGYGFGNNDKPASGPAERATSAASNPTPASGSEKPASNLAWGGNGGPWGSNKNSLGAQTSVWG